jgi:AraC family transcriptional regulator
LDDPSSSNPHQTDYGKGFRRYSCAAGTIIIKRVPAELSVSRHEHDCAHLSILLSGYAEEEWQNRSVERTCNVMTLHPAGSHHAMQFHREGSTSLVIELVDDFVDSFDRMSVASSYVRHAASQIVASVAIGDSLELHETVLALVTHVKNQNALTQDRPPIWLSNVAQAVMDNLSEIPTLQALAETAGVEPAHMVRMYRRYFGTTIGTASRRARLAHARTLMLDQDMPLAHVAAETGFADQSHMGRWFRREYGVTPQRLSRIFNPALA